MNITEKRGGKKKLPAEQLGRCPSQRGMTYGMPSYASACIRIRYRMRCFAKQEGVRVKGG